MLFETVHILESINLLELLPVEVTSWYDQQKINQEQEERAAQRTTENWQTPSGF